MPFQIQAQQKGKWCWAAVAVSIDRYFSGTTSGLSQCKLAQQVVGGTANCCAAGTCNSAKPLQDALRVVNNLVSAKNATLSFAEIQAEIDAFKPIAIRIAWFGGGGHFVVIDGYQEFTSGEQEVHIADPDGGYGYNLDYNELFGGSELGGNWTSTFKLSP